MTTHIGKIARLSRRRREDVSRRLANGLPGGEILKWLNKLKDVKAVLKTQFGGRQINKQNLSAWRKSGYVEWLQLEEARGRADRLVEKADDLAKRAGKRGLGDGLAILLALEMDGAMETLLKPEADPEKRWERVREIHREVSRLRRDDDRVKRTALREKRDKATGQRLKAEGGDPSSLRSDAASEDEEYWNQQEPSPQGIEAAREAMAAMGPGASNAANEDEDEDEDEDEQNTAGQEESRQVKAGQGEDESKIQSPRAKVQSSLPRIVERGPASPGREYVKIKDKTGLWFKEVPKGWQVPADWKSPDDLARMRYEGTEGDEGKGAEARPAMEGNKQNGNAGLEAEARPSGFGNTGLESPVNSQTGKSAVHKKEPSEAEARSAKLAEFQAERAALGLPVGKPYTPDPDPEVEAYNRRWRMKCGFEPFDYEELQRVEAELPRKKAECQARLLSEKDVLVEGAGI